jgi:hypothetical protein
LEANITKAEELLFFILKLLFWGGSPLGFSTFQSPLLRFGSTSY